MKSLASLSLEGRRALVTGAGTGIGKQIALGFGEAGAEVVLVGRTRAYLDETASELAAGGAVGIVIPADVTVEDDVQRIATEAGQIEKAAALWGKAGLRSAQRSALVEAAEQLRRALGQIARVSLIVQFGFQTRDFFVCAGH